MKTKHNSGGVLDMLIAMILSGTLGVFVVESDQSSFNVVFYRCLFGTLALGAFCYYRGLFKPAYFTKRNVLITLLGGACLVFNWVFLFKSFALTSITIATVVYHTQPFFVLLLSALIFRTTINRHQLLWVITAFIGLVLVTDLDVATLVDVNAYIAGVGFALAAAVLYAVLTLATKQIQEQPPHLTALMQVALGIILLWPFATLSDVPTIGNHWYYLIGLGVIHTCVMYIYLYAAFQRLPVTSIAAMSFIYPVVAMICDYLIYGTHINLSQILGILLVFISSLAVNLKWRFLPVRPRIVSN
ncbi:DMT family transporter [Motiliproteus sp. MSK22-1]|uniref:DMT family transporter n=1 Tax=Motiliproteus sp. MSK22-1 TaxID=1897630 RepID=UPI000977D06E|nr:DMT family transporter [Motiliproteus sp. MSK22-1]OMH36173.1 multidrug DMT transporter permease [Motiliproteus sp. MSK22-1]